LPPIETTTDKKVVLPNALNKENGVEPTIMI